jgi:hypothetical protein
MLVFNKYFYKKKKLKLYFGDHVAVLNNFIYQNRREYFSSSRGSIAMDKGRADQLIVGLAGSSSIQPAKDL